MAVSLGRGRRTPRTHASCPADIGRLEIRRESPRPRQSSGSISHQACRSSQQDIAAHQCREEVSAYRHRPCRAHRAVMSAESSSASKPRLRTLPLILPLNVPPVMGMTRLEEPVVSIQHQRP